MKFTREQFDDMGPFHVDELNINNDQEFMFKVFNLLPDDLQGEVVKWGFNDTPAREAIFEHLVDILHRVSVAVYYNDKMGEDGNLDNDYVLSKLGGEPEPSNDKIGLSYTLESEGETVRISITGTGIDLSDVNHIKIMEILTNKMASYMFAKAHGIKPEDITYEVEE